MAKASRKSDDRMERIEWQLDQIRQSVMVLAAIAVLGIVLGFVAAAAGS